MPQTLRFHLDEHVPQAIAVGLRHRGIDVTTAAEVGLRGAADEAHVAFALANGRVLYTNDDDYLVLHHHGTEHAGIAYCRQQRRSIGQVIQALTLLWELFEPEEMRNHVEFI
jgi:predicted nuclease of predicted toxin-antitoxin system